MAKKKIIPSYRCKKDRGRERAVVTLPDEETGYRQTYRLGQYGSDESRERYGRLIAAWEANGRRLPDSPESIPVAGGVTITQLCYSYRQGTKNRYCPKYTASLKVVMKLLRAMHKATPITAFGPNMLRDVRQSMVDGNPAANPPRRPWSRRTSNQATRIIVSIFKWGVAHEIVPVRIYEALRTIEPLRRGEARETDPVKPASEAAIDAAIEHMRPPVRAMVQLQLMTGMRPGEVVVMRPCDIDMSGRVWLYQLQEHKTAYHGKSRTIYIGPKAQKIIRPYLKRPTTAYLFSPAEALADMRRERREKRKTNDRYGNRPGTNRKVVPERIPQEKYTVDSYRRAITRACDKADQAAKDKAAESGHELPEDVRLVPRWHPHQLRHNYATNVRRDFGLEAAQILLGHSSALITDAVYAERDAGKAIEIAAKIG